MLQLKFRIGTKLAIASGLSILLVGGIIANQQLSGGSIESAANAAQNQSKVADSILQARGSLRGMQIGGKDIRLARTDNELNRAAAELIERYAAFQQQIDDGLSRVAQTDNRQRLQKIKAVVMDYFNVSNELVNLTRAGIDNQKHRNETAQDWRKTFETVLNSKHLASQHNSREIEGYLRQADTFYLAAQNASLRAIANDEADQEEAIKKFSEQAMTRLKEAQSFTADVSVAADIDMLSSSFTAFTSKIAEALKIEEDKIPLVRDRAMPAAASAEKLMTDAVEAAEKYSDDALEELVVRLSKANQIGLGIGLAVIVVLIGSAMFGSFSIARPIRRVGEVLIELASGNKSVDVPYANRHDEVGDNARAAQTFKENLIRIEKMEAEQRESEQRAAGQRKADMQKLADDFESTVGNIIGTVSTASTELESAAVMLTKTAETTQQLSAMVASASEEASSNVQSVASASEELTGSVNEIARQVQESSRIASEAVQQANKTDARINELLLAASRIGDVVKLITAIAEQTNLLALNATIEAARAGEAGRGFAVVAQEVKALASQTAKATEEISVQISGMQSATQESVAAIKEIGGTINRISEIASTIAAAVEEQGAATQEISRNVQQAAHGTSQVAENIGDVNKGASETGSASAQVLSFAQSLANESTQLKSAVETFVATVRAA